MNTKTIYKTGLNLFFTLVILSGAGAAIAAPPDTMNYQGHLTDSSGVAIDGSVSITFAIYNVDLGGLPLWSDSRSVTVEKGVFSVELGGGLNPFPLGLFEAPLWMGLTVGADTEMAPRRPISSVGFAFKAADADTLEGVSAASLDQSAHVGDTSNPHSVTASQVGAATPADITWNNLTGKPAGFADNIDNDSGGDITAVLAGSGLIGGGTSGSVILSHQDTSGQSSLNNSNGIVIQDIFLDGFGHTTSLGSINLDLRYFTEAESDGRFVNVSGDTMTGALTVQSSFTLEGALTIDSGSDIRILDNFNGFRWYDSAGTDQFGALLINSNQNQFYDANQSRPVFHSNVNGIGIGTSAPLATHAVTVPSLNVTGQLEVGLQRVSTIYPLSSTATCHAHGNLTCYYGSGSVSCPVGTRVLGGGTTGSNARYGAIGQSYPASTTSWTCSASYDLINSSRNCYAICARLE